MRRLPGTPRCHVFSENGLQQGNFLKQKISQVKIKGFFCVLREQVLPLVLFLSPVPPALQPPAHSPMSPGKPPSLHCTKAGSRVLPTAPGRHANPPGHCSHLCSLSCSLSKLRVSWALQGGTTPLFSQDTPSDPKCNRESKVHQQLPSLPPQQAGTCCTHAGNGEQTHKPEPGHPTGYVDYSLFCRITVWCIFRAEFLSLPKVRAWEVIGAKMTLWYCPGQLCWLHSMLSICSKRCGICIGG